MKTTQECWQALIDGDALIHEADTLPVMLKDGQLIRSDGLAVNKYFHRAQAWSIYTPPEWYDNIPEHGVLCWVSDENETPDRNDIIELIVDYCRCVSSRQPKSGFISPKGLEMEYATPLTKQEIQQLLDNAPEGEQNESNQR